ncbi:hypothetical protein BO70DRAFT_394911 [Aspergillus heteromorphus CBS 117.55]|uniref:Myb-like DNA-binding domain-containing protein n=1 Tax=Aspergillus heteromorphus CBS 117.55 TaxID=1448321 RepID=A0A317WP81_9EURO|nr:uncharacterized protein BO70DRAFT_394911 [Aspergillus heteromorphus CBS 117.55]PWY86897.1 hypothetical protein BO70DRAFT_394911 [Aspergillus heteromorphus CBS 117.55]
MSSSKTTRITPEEQFQFLLSCIRYANNGKIDFATVAQECNIVSKAAAAKRYERLMKAHNINPSGGPLSSNKGNGTADGEGGDGGGPSGTKNRKRKSPAKANAGADSDDGSPEKKKAKGMRKMVLDRAETLVEKAESMALIKNEVQSGDEEEAEEHAAGVDGASSFDQMCDEMEEEKLAMKEEDEN